MAYVNRDGIPDLVACAATSPGSILTFLHNGSGFSAPVSSPGIENPTGLALVDLDRDGRVDALTAGMTSILFPGAGFLGANLGNGDGTFQNVRIYGGGNVPYRLAVADVDADGQPKVAVSHKYDSTFRALTVLKNVVPPSAPVWHFGTGTPGCSGKLALSINSAPNLGNPGFAFTATNAPKSSLGLFLIGNAADVFGSQILGVGALLHIDVLASTEFLGTDIESDAGGTAILTPSPIPIDPAILNM